MTVIHSSVSTVCTASHLTNWSIPGLDSTDEKILVNTKLKEVENLMQAGFKRDFAMLEIIITDQQRTKYNLEDFIKNIGFEFTRMFPKSDAKATQRHQETGDLYLYTTTPKIYEKALKEYHKELVELKEKIDPPKKPDPKRQKFPDLLLSALRKAGMVHDNTSVNNPVHQVLTVSEDVLYRHLKMKYGMDIKKWNNLGDGWTKITIRQLKQYQIDWKNELV
jgi:hypothetical protein